MSKFIRVYLEHPELRTKDLEQRAPANSLSQGHVLEYALTGVKCMLSVPGDGGNSPRTRFLVKGIF